jgi:hypothetical protein
MATDRNDDFTLTHYLNLATQRDTILDQVPFFLGLKDNPPALRRILEAILAAVNWTVNCVTHVGTPHSPGADDVVFLANSTGGILTMNLPAVAASEGRVFVVKDAGGLSGTNPITIAAAAADTIDGLNTSFSLSANYGAIILIAGCAASNEWHTIALV